MIRVDAAAMECGCDDGDADDDDEDDALGECGRACDDDDEGPPFFLLPE